MSIRNVLSPRTRSSKAVELCLLMSLRTQTLTIILLYHLQRSFWMDTRWRKMLQAAQPHGATTSRTAGRQIVPRRCLYRGGKTCPQAALCVIGKFTSHLHAKPIPSHRNPGSMAELDQDNVLLLTLGYSHLPETQNQGEGRLAWNSC